VFAELGLLAVGALEAEADKEEFLWLAAAGFDAHNAHIGALGELKPPIRRIFKRNRNHNGGNNPSFVPQPPLQLRIIKLPLRTNPYPQTHRLLPTARNREAQARLQRPEHQLLPDGLSEHIVALKPLELAGAAAGGWGYWDGAGLGVEEEGGGVLVRRLMSISENIGLYYKGVGWGAKEGKGREEWGERGKRG
jgi:hypothetical protein